MNFQPVDHLPRWEWAMWWGKTIERWHQEGLPKDLHFSNVFGISGGFIPGVDHQTHPGVSLEQYHRCYLKLLNEYTC